MEINLTTTKGKENLANMLYILSSLTGVVGIIYLLL